LRSSEKRQYLSEILIPELSHNYKFPADYWLKAMLLPCIIHRANYLLLAEELRLKLIADGIDDGRGHQVFKLDINYGNYDNRETIIEEKDRSDMVEESSLPPGEFEKLLKEILLEKKKNISSGFKTSQNMTLPVDLERDLLNVTVVDIENYTTYVLKNNQIGGGSQLLLRKKVSKVLSLKDTENRKEIKLLNFNGKNCSIQQKDLIKVLTTSNSGDVFDMERFETIGDAFLKFIASLFLFKSHETWHEGHLTNLKGRMVSNRNLFYIGNDYGMSSMLKTTKFYDGMIGKNYLIGLAPGTKLPSNIEETLQTNKNYLTQLLNIELSMEEIEVGMMTNSNLKSFLNSCKSKGDDMFDNTLLPNIRGKNKIILH
jgi:endoribonuclease Dicer